MTCLSGAKTMESILASRLSSDLTVTPLEAPSKFCRAMSANFRMDGKQKRWDFVEAMPSVAVALVDTDLDALVVVRQFRAPVYASLCREQGVEAGALPMSMGFTYELCAGLVDKEGMSLEEITSEEIHEECGYRVEPRRIRQLSSHVTSAGTSGVRQTVFVCRAGEADRDGAGGGGLAEDGEAIEVLAVPVGNLEAFLLDDSLPKSAGLQFAGTWLLLNGADQLP